MESPHLLEQIIVFPYSLCKYYVLIYSFVLTSCVPTKKIPTTPQVKIIDTFGLDLMMKWNPRSIVSHDVMILVCSH